MIKLILNACVVVCAATSIAGCGTPDSALFDMAQKAVAAELKDPESAKFNNEYVVDFPEPSTKYTRLRTVCGEVNAKNAFGAYPGAVRYVVLLGIPNNGSSYQALSVDLEQTPRDPVFTASFWTSCSKNERNRF